MRPPFDPVPLPAWAQFLRGLTIAVAVCAVVEVLGRTSLAVPYPAAVLILAPMAACALAGWLAGAVAGLFTGTYLAAVLFSPTHFYASPLTAPTRVAFYALVTGTAIGLLGWLRHVIVQRHAFSATMFDSSPDAIAACTGDGTILRANALFVSAFGPLSESRSQNIVSMLSLDQPLADLARQGPVEVHAHRADGRAAWLDVRVVAPAGGARGAFLVVLRDVSERRELAERLAAERRRFEMLFEQNPAPMWVYEVGSGRLLAVNDTAVTRYGYPRDRMSLMTVMDLVPSERRSQVADRVAAPHTGPYEWHDAEHVRADGSRLDVVVLASDIDFDGRPARLVLPIDVTAQRRSEAEIEALQRRIVSTIESIGEGFLLVDHDWRARYVNSRGADLVGRSRETIVGQSALELFSADVNDRFVESAQGALEDRTPRSVEAHDATAGRWLAIRVSPTADGLAVSFDDVTAAKRVEAELAQARKMEAVGNLAGGIAHDFNNILTAILGYAELLVEDLPEPDARRAEALEIQNAAGRAAQLTRQLLAFSRKQVLQPTLLDINEVVTSLSRLLPRLVTEAVAFETKLDMTVGTIVADRAQLEQVLLNLVVNARDAMPEGGRVVVETAHVVLEPDAHEGEGARSVGPHVRLSVIDTGHGMDEPTRARIFDPFFTTKPAGKGTGLGLASVYGIVRQSGGFIEVDTEPGQGTAFHVYLPVAARTDGDDEPALEAPTGQISTGRGETVLLVEDQADVRALVREVLGRHGFTVVEATTPEAAIEFGRTEMRIDLLLTDVVMPQQSGPKVAAALRAERPHLAVLFMSGYTEDPGVRAEIAEGAAFLQKPFTPTGLVRAVCRALEPTETSTS